MKNSFSIKTLTRIYSYSGEYGGLMTKAWILLTLSTVFGVLPFFGIREIIVNFLSGDITLGSIAVIAGIILVCLLLKIWLYTRGLMASHELAYDTLMGMRKKSADKLLKIPMGRIEEHGTGGLKKIFVENIEEMELMLAHAIPEGVANIITVLVVLIVLFILDWRLALLSLGSLPIGFAATVGMMKSGIKKMGSYYQAAKEMNENIIEYISGMEVVKVFGQTTKSFKKYSDSVEKYKLFTLDWFRESWNYMVIYSIVLPLTVLFLLPFGALIYLGGGLELSTFVLCILLAMSMGPPLMRVVEFIPQIPQIGVKAEKIESLLKEENMAEGSVINVPDDHTVAFSGVTFAYKDTEVLRDVSFSAKPNTVTALVGESGAGKSTVAKLLVRFYDVKQGAITIGGRDIREFPFETLMNAISYVSQDIFLFNTSIMENIRMGDPNATDMQVMEIAKLAQCHDFIMGMENGYETVAGGSGDKLSGGERQRIAIARAMLKNAPIVILDEATSFADPENEDNIQAALNGLIAGKMLIVIAHRLSTITEADNIIVMDAGRIADQGRHEELLEKSPAYKKLWQSNVQKMEWGITVGQKEEAIC